MFSSILYEVFHSGYMLTGASCLDSQFELGCTALLHIHTDNVCFLQVLKTVF